MSFITQDEKMKALSLLERLSLKEKCSLLEGKNYWESASLARFDLPSIRMSDGPSGLRKQEGEADYLGKNASKPSICYPAPVTCASTFHPALLYELGKSLGQECLQENIGILLSPGINHKRTPLNGRNFEYYSEDPYLTSQMAKQLIDGVQSMGIGCSLKHFCCNNQEKARMINDSIVDDRALAEIYLKSFYTLIKQTSPATIMLAYNKLNGTYCCENKILMDLGRKWGFEGAYISDWGALNSVGESFKRGLNLEMPGANGETRTLLYEYLRQHKWSEKELDQAVLPVLELLVKNKTLASKAYSLAAHKAIAKQIAQEGIVLLKNENAILPLSNQPIALIGRMAQYPHYQGSGSSRVNPIEVETLASYFPEAVYAAGYDEKGNADADLLQEAVEAAQKQEIVLLVVGLLEESEGEDRVNLDLPKGMEKLIGAISQVNPNCIVIVQAGSSILMPWIDQVQAVLFPYLSGSYGGEALYEVLKGKVSPSGKLPESFVRSMAQLPWFLKEKHRHTTLYIESVYTGYRYYNKAKIDLLFPFGYGLSYTKFSLADFSVSNGQIRCTIENVGGYDGAETIQLYVDSTNDFSVPKLLNFQKVFLKQKEKKEVILTWRLDDLKEYFDGWILREGLYVFSLGTSSKDKVYTWEQKIAGKKSVVLTSYQTAQQVPELTIEDFQNLYGKEWEKGFVKKPYDENVTVYDLLQNSWVLKKGIHFLIEKVLNKEMSEYQNLLEDLPLRTLKLNGIGGRNRKAILEAINGHWLKGLKTTNWKEWKEMIHKVRELE